MRAEGGGAGAVFECGGKDGLGDGERGGRGGRLRGAAAARLGQAGDEADPSLRGAARGMLTRRAEYLRPPPAQKPILR